MNKDLDTPIVPYLTPPSIYEESEGGLELSKFKNIIFRNYPLIIGLALLSGILGFVKISVTPPVYMANFELLSEPLNIETKVTATDKESTEAREQIGSVELNDVQLKIVESPKIISRTIESLRNKYPQLNYNELIKDLNIEIITDPKSEEKILLVEYENPDKQKVSDVINSLTKTYLDYSVEKRLAGVKRGINFLDQQIPKAFAKVEKIENQITELRKRKKFISPEHSLVPINRRSHVLKQKRQDIPVQLKELQLMSRNLEQELKTNPTKFNTLIQLNDSRSLTLLNQLQEQELMIRRKSAIFSKNSIEIETLQQEKQQIIALIIETGESLRQKLDNQIETLEYRQQIVKEDLDDIQLELVQWSQASTDYNHLIQELRRANEKLAEFTLQKDALAIDAAQQRGPWTLLTPATEPITNNTSLINTLILSSTFGLLAGVALSYLFDSYKKVIYDSVIIQNITEAPILSIIPYSPNSKQLPSFIKKLNPRKELRQVLVQEETLQEQEQYFGKLVSPSIETFRSFAANLGLLNLKNNLKSLDVDIDNNLKSIAITSATPGEGKSTVAVNLAVATASMGKRVLLVDTDLRSLNSISTDLGLEAEQGLKNILKQDHPETSGLNYIKPTPLDDNLFVLPSGSNEQVTNFSGAIVVNSGRLLASTKMHLLMEELKNHFDLIIYDLCAIIGLADVNLLATKTDGIVIVTGLGKIQTDSLTEAIDQLKLCRAPVLGIAVNKLVNKAG